MESRHAKQTVTRQLIAGFGCLIFGVIFITLIVKYGNSWGLHWSDGSKHDFLIIGWFGYLSLISIIGLMIHVQFVDALNPQEVFRKSIKYSIFPWLLSLLFPGLFSLLLGGISSAVGEFIISSAIFPTIGLTVGVIQGLRLHLENFSPTEHRLFISNEADIEACRKNELPYRHKVVGFWRVFGLALFSSAWLIMLFSVMMSKNSDIGLAVLMLLGISAILVIATLQQLDFIQNPQLTTTEGQIRKESWCAYRSSHLGVICNGQKLFMDTETWNRILDDRNCILWYSPKGTPLGSNFVGRVVAFEYK